MVRFAVTVQTCGDLGTIRPLVEGQPSTEFPLQTVSVPSNVNSYVLPPPLTFPATFLAVNPVRQRLAPTHALRMGKEI